ncbi:hemolysin family protein [Paenibacillus sp. TH7-28]
MSVYGTDLIKLAVIFALIAFTALFVVAEYSLRALRPGRVDTLLRQGRKNADALKKLAVRSDQALSSCQLAITAISLTLGWLGQPAVRQLLRPLFLYIGLSEPVESFFSFLIAFIFITYLHVVLGGLVPQVLAAQRGELFALAASRPLLWFTTLLHPFIWLLNRSSRWIVSLLGLKPPAEWNEAHSMEELRALLSQSLESGQINTSEYSFLSRIIAFNDKLAKDIMVPRTDMVCLHAGRSLEENL